jgi:hypothetical protein
VPSRPRPGPIDTATYDVVLDALRALLGAFALWKEVPEDWRTIHRDVYSDYIREADSVMGILRPEDEEEPSGNGDVAVTDIGKPAET